MGGEMHIGAKLRQLALWHGDRTAIIDDAGAWSFRQFNARITRFGKKHGRQYRFAIDV